MNDLLKNVILVFVFVLSSCEGYVDYKGIVYDAQTKAPLDSVKCVIVTCSECIAYSDSLGNYYVTTGLVGCVPNCGEYEVEFSKPGYKTQTVKAPKNVYLDIFF